MSLATIRLAVSWFVIGGVVFAGGAASAQGRYSPVSEENVMALQFNHYFTPDDKGHEPDFEWTFTMGEFAIKKGKGAIPADLQKKLFAEGAEEIRGKWKLDGKGGQHLVLSEIRAGDKVKMKEVRLPIYKTAPTVVRIGEPQYVFAIGR
jgi:hypothetical protein